MRRRRRKGASEANDDNASIFLALCVPGVAEGADEQGNEAEHDTRYSPDDGVPRGRVGRRGEAETPNQTPKGHLSRSDEPDP